MNAICRPAHPLTPYTLHTLSIGDKQGKTKKYVTAPTRKTRTYENTASAPRGEKSTMVKGKRGREERYARPLPATPTHPLHLAHALYRGRTRYDKEVCYRTDTQDTYI